MSNTGDVKQPSAQITAPEQAALDQRLLQQLQLQAANQAISQPAAVTGDGRLIAGQIGLTIGNPLETLQIVMYRMLEQSKQELTTRHDKDIERITYELKRKDKEIDEMKEKLEYVKAKNKKYKEENARLQKEVNALQSEVKELTIKNKNLEDRVTRMEDTLKQIQESFNIQLHH